MNELDAGERPSRSTHSNQADLTPTNSSGILQKFVNESEQRSKISTKKMGKHCCVNPSTNRIYRVRKKYVCTVTRSSSF